MIATYNAKGKIMAWIFLYISIVLEIAGTSFLKLSQGLEKGWYALAAFVCYFFCFSLIAKAFKTLPMGIAYAIWCGVGMVAVALIGLFVFGEKIDWIKACFICMIVIGSIGLNLVTK